MAAMHGHACVHMSVRGQCCSCQGGRAASSALRIARAPHGASTRCGCDPGRGESCVCHAATVRLALEADMAICRQQSQVVGASKGLLLLPMLAVMSKHPVQCSHDQACSQPSMLCVSQVWCVTAGTSGPTAAGCRVGCNNLLKQHCRGTTLLRQLPAAQCGSTAADWCCRCTLLL